MECTIGGTRRHLGDITRGLLERGWDVHLAVGPARPHHGAEGAFTRQEVECVICTKGQVGAATKQTNKQSGV